MVLFNRRINQIQSREPSSEDGGFFESIGDLRWAEVLGHTPIPDCFTNADFDHVACRFYSTSVCPLVEFPLQNEIQSLELEEEDGEEGSGEGVRPVRHSDEDQPLSGRAARHQLAALLQ